MPHLSPLPRANQPVNGRSTFSGYSGAMATVQAENGPAAKRRPRRRLPMPMRLAAALALGGAVLAVVSVYESARLGLFPLGEVRPIADPWHFARTGFTLAFSLLLTAIIARGRAPGGPIAREPMPAAGSAAAWAVLALACASTLAFLADPAAFAAAGREDGAVEWASALLPLAGSGLFVGVALRPGPGGNFACLAALGFAALLLAIGMEEISWGQRMVGFATPEELARLNMQKEFNLHNLHTDLSEIVYYVGAGAFLVLLPLLRDCWPLPARLAWLERFIPSRWVAAAAAPIMLFDYGQWNVIPIQAATMLTVLACLCWAAAAMRRGDRGEALLFASLAAGVTAGQAAFLARGHLLPNIWDASEHKELFIALGLAAFAVDAALRSRRT